MNLLFTIMAALVVGSAIGVVAIKNPIHSALCLVMNLLTVAGLFAMLDAHFLAVVQIIVYAGAIMVLVLFVLMLLNVKVETPKRRELTVTVITILVGLAFLAFMMPMINESFSNLSVSARDVVGGVTEIGELLYTKYLFPFEAASVLIMAAIVGAVMIAKRNYRTPK